MDLKDIKEGLGKILTRKAPTGSEFVASNIMVIEMSEGISKVMVEIAKVERKLEEIEKKLEELIEDNERYCIMKLSEESLWEFLESEPDIYTEDDVKVKLR